MASTSLLLSLRFGSLPLLLSPYHDILATLASLPWPPHPCYSRSASDPYPCYSRPTMTSLLLSLPYHGLHILATLAPLRIPTLASRPYSRFPTMASTSLLLSLRYHGLARLLFFFGLALGAAMTSQNSTPTMASTSLLLSLRFGSLLFFFGLALGAAMTSPSSPLSSGDLDFSASSPDFARSSPERTAPIWEVFESTGIYFFFESWTQLHPRRGGGVRPPPRESSLLPKRVICFSFLDSLWEQR